MIAKPTLSLATSGYSGAINMEGYQRALIQINAPTGDDAGDFYVVTRADSTAAWQRTTMTAAKAGATPLVTGWEWPTRVGKEIAIEWDRSGGSDGVTTQIWIHLDGKL
jgi:hypothetical protein